MIMKPEENNDIYSERQIVDRVIDKTGYGCFHVLLLFVAGWAIISDMVEITSISFVIPVLDNSSDPSIQPTKFQSGALSSVIFVGMMIGSYFWGGLGDIIGRKVCLMLCLAVNGVFGFASSLSPNFGVFMFLRFASGIGVGGSVPLVYTYCYEFFSQKYGDIFIVTVATFWGIGRLYTSLLAWLVIPRSISFNIGALNVTNWRLFLMLSAFPSLSSVVALLFLPESPGYLFSKNKQQKALKVLERISWCNYCRKRPNDEDTDQLLSSLKNGSVRSSSSSIVGINVTIKKMKKVCLRTIDLFRISHLRSTIVMIVVFFTLSFGSFGFTLWLPEYFKLIEQQANNGTDIMTSYIDSKIYLDNIYVSLVAVPSFLVSLILIKIIGARILLTISMVMSALSTFAIWGVPKRINLVVLLSCVFNGVSGSGWTALNVVVPDLFEAYLRTTAFGFLSAVGRLGSIAGTLIFGRLITVNQYLPILIAASLFIIGGIAILGAPFNKRKPRIIRSISSALHCCYKKKYFNINRNVEESVIFNSDSETINY